MSLRGNAHIGGFRTPVTPANSPTGQAWKGKVYTGEKLDIRNEDPEHKKPQRALQKGQAKVFNMEDEKDNKQYCIIMEHAVSHRVHIATKQILAHRIPLCIYLEWYDDVYVAPDKTNKK
jgi:hypothetical protein